MCRKYRFHSIRVKKTRENHLSSKVPDYDNIIRMSKTYFTLKGWLSPTSSDISYVLEEITDDRLRKDVFLRKSYIEFIQKEKDFNWIEELKKLRSLD